MLVQGRPLSFGPKAVRSPKPLTAMSSNIKIFTYSRVSPIRLSQRLGVTWLGLFEAKDVGADTGLVCLLHRSAKLHGSCRVVVAACSSRQPIINGVGELGLTGVVGNFSVDTRRFSSLVQTARTRAIGSAWLQPRSVFWNIARLAVLQKFLLILA